MWHLAFSCARKHAARWIELEEMDRKYIPKKCIDMKSRDH